MVKMSDIAAHLGVSRLTVSAVLNNRLKQVGVSEETARRVRAAAESLGYHRNHLALAMKTGVNPVIGCLVSDLKSEWTSRTLSGLLNATHASGYLTKIEEVTGPQKEQAALDRFMEQRVAGIFCCNFNPGREFITELENTARQHKTPVICSLSAKNLGGDWVDSDDSLGIRLAVQHVHGLGHHRIGFVGGQNEEEPRITSFRATMKDLGLATNFVSTTNWNLTRAQELAEEWLGMKRGRPTAILCANDHMAAIIARKARQMGYEMPRDLSLVGFSDSWICRFIDPPLTSVAQPFEEIGTKCGLLLMDLIQGAKRKRPSPLVKQLVRTDLVIRESTAPAPNSSRKK